MIALKVWQGNRFFCRLVGTDRLRALGEAGQHRQLPLNPGVNLGPGADDPEGAGQLRWQTVGMSS